MPSRQVDAANLGLGNNGDCSARGAGAFEGLRSLASAITVLLRIPELELRFDVTLIGITHPYEVFRLTDVQDFANNGIKSSLR
jgi:hypothetical protein